MKSAVVVVAILLLVGPSGTFAAQPRRWELVPTSDGGFERYDTTQGPKNVDVTASDVEFRLYTRANPNSPQILTAGGSYIGNFVVSKQTKFVTHGWRRNGGNMSHIRDGWILAGDYNVIVIDWSVHAGVDDYLQAIAAVPGVGEVVAKFIDWLVYLNASTNDMQLVGHSLGAHVCGVAGNRVTAGKLNRKLNRITGLDPAGPFYDRVHSEDRLDASDASFVQVIHTHGTFYGWRKPLGTADFYPNGGLFQPGCYPRSGALCSHDRAHEYFAESITSEDGFWAKQCGIWEDYDSGKCNDNPSALMGETVSASANGTYYLKTRDDSPYALG